MGYASYHEDINSRIAAMDGIVHQFRKIGRLSELNENEELRRYNQRLLEAIKKLKCEISGLQKIMQQISRENTKKESQLKQQEGKSNSLLKQLSHEADLRKDQEKAGRDLGELVFDFNYLFQSMNEIIKSNSWHQDKVKLKQLASLIETGVRRS